MTIDAKNVKPEVVAVIAAAVAAMMGGQVKALRISNVSLAWAMAGRSKNMNTH